MICHKNSKRLFRVLESSGCPKLLSGKEYTLEELSGNHCKYLLHSLYPYYLTLKRGGHFRWVMEGDGVVAKCTSVLPSVEVIVSADNEKGPVGKVHNVKGNCPASYKIEDKLNLDSVPCLDLLAQILPLMLTDNGQEYEFNCQGCPLGSLKGLITQKGE